MLDLTPRPDDGTTPGRWIGQMARWRHLAQAMVDSPDCVSLRQAIAVLPHGAIFSLPPDAYTRKYGWRLVRVPILTPRQR